MRSICALLCMLVVVSAVSATPRERWLFSLPMRVSEDENLMPRPSMSPPPCRSNHTRHENLCVRRLSGRVDRLEKALAAVCSSVIHADDVALSERNAAAVGDIYMDAGLATSRNPRMLRRSLLQVMARHGIVNTPPETHWHYKHIFDDPDLE